MAGSAAGTSYMRFLRWVTLPLWILLLAVPFCLQKSSTAGGIGEGAAPIQKLILISPHSENVRTEFARAFSDWTLAHRGHRTDFEWLNLGGTSEGIRYVKSEFARSPTGINVDLFFGGGVDPYLQLKTASLLQPCSVATDVLAHIPATLDGMQLYDPEGYWYGACLGSFGIIYNKRVIDREKLPTPLAWSDLADPKLLSWVGSGDPRFSGSIHMAYEIILQGSGWSIGWSNLAAMCANTRNFSRSAGEVPKDAALGEVACGMAIDVYAWREVAEAGGRMDFVMPDKLTIIAPDSIAILKGAPHAQLAADFVTFVLSEEGQKLWYLKRGVAGGPVEFELNRMPVIPARVTEAGTNASVHMDPFAHSGSFFTYNATLGAARWTVLNDLIGACLIDPHPELQAAWKHAIQDSNDSTIRELILSPPISESNLLKLASGDWNDPAIRSRMKSDWAEQARKRYQAAREL